MAFRAVTRHFWRSHLMNGNGMEGGERLGRAFASSTTPKMRLFSPTIDSVHPHDHHHLKSRVALKADLAPVYIVAGFVVVALSIGVHTAKQQLFHSPAVQVNKKRRESVHEVDDPDSVIGEADKFLNKSFLRKVAHIQDNQHRTHDPVRANPYTRPREVESLKSVGAQ